MKTLMSFVSLLLVVGVSFYQAMVFMLFYNWFAAPTFTLPIIGYWLSFALIMTVSVLKTKGVHKSLLHYMNTTMTDEDKWTMDIANSVEVFIALNLALFVGWLIQLNL